MRLLLINYEFPPLGGGGGIVTASLAREYAAKGHQVLVLTASFRDLPRFEIRDGYRIERVPALRSQLHSAKVSEMLSFDLSASWTGLWRVRDFRPDLIHCFFGIPTGPVAYLLGRTYRIPYVVFLGGRDVPRPHPDPPHYKYLYVLLKPAIRAIWREAAAVVACSEGLRELARQTDPRVPIRVIPDGIDLSRFRAKPPVPSDSSRPFRILGIGRLIPRKGFDTLLRAAAELKSRTGRPFQVRIVGEGPEGEPLRRLAQALGIADRVEWAGTVPYERLPEQYAWADLFVLSSHAEGMPLVVLEAMATALPILATPVQGMDELVQEAVNGYRFPVGDAKALADRMQELLEDPERCVAMGQESRRIVAKYAWPQIAERYLALFEEVLSRSER
ncbi:MAG: 1,2-diacylglycerol 3-glucosyltransferase [Candidatus Poribacteria bacterium]|nr:MAG: 1,2-diacylglycerol 3-glucosyltransferase [Candidatus Poribacteria bacterium]